jgi:hypothetical protein
VRIVYTSDLHADLGERNAALLEPLAAHVASLHPDVFVVAGDLAERAATVTDSLRRFAAVGGTKLYLAGNHDLYVEGEAALARGEDSRAKFERLLPAAAARAGFGYLGLEPHVRGDTALVAVPGWYDFAFRDPALEPVVSLRHYRAGGWRDVRAFDRGHVLWPRHGASPPAGAAPALPLGDWAGDEEIDADMCRRLEAQLAAVPGARRLVAVTHVLPFADMVQRGAFASHPFHDGWLGSAGLGDILQRQPRLRAVIAGHLHRVCDRDRRGVRLLARPVGNAAHSGLPLEQLARERVGVLDLD